MSAWIFLAGVTLLGVGVATEAAGLLRFALREGALFYGAARAPRPSQVPRPGFSAHALHPYFGFAVRPGSTLLLGPNQPLAPYLEGGPGGAEPPDWLRRRSNNLGFYGASDYPLHDPDAFVIGVFGGSVAHLLALQSGARLEQRVSQALGGRPTRVLDLAGIAWKQPQQLLVLAYLLSVGQRLDWVVNLDGFNEAVLARANLAGGVDASMPALEFLRPLEVRASSDDPGRLRYRLALERLRGRALRLERWRDETRLASVHLLADLALGWTLARYRSLATRPPAPEQRESAVLLAGRLPTPPDASAPDARIAGGWFRSSRAMGELARASGARYLHVLQPNQYVGERRFGAQEQRLAVNPKSPYAAPARALYPTLQRWGARLRDEGIDFRDATALFDAVPEAVYADDCCHLNQRGNDLLADWIAGAIAGIGAGAPGAAPGRRTQP